MAQHTITCPCIEDTYTNASAPDTNYGSEQILVANTLSNGGKAFLKFDIPIAVRYKKIIAAKLRVYVIRPVTDYWTYLYASTFNLQWSENTLTYNQASFMSNVQILCDDTNPSIPDEGWIERDLDANIIQQNLNNFIDNGLCIDSRPYEIFYIRSREYAGYEPTLTLQYEDVIPQAPTNLSPNGLIIDGDLDNRFSWTFTSEVADYQTKFDLQWSSDNGQTWNTITRTTSATYYDMPSRYLPNRNIVWRVRTYGYDEIAGPWSELATVDVYGSPPDPTITTPSMVNNARPTIEWTIADPQTAYEIQVLLGDTIVWQTGEVTGTEQSVLVGIDLENQNYTIRLRYRNTYDRWSNWVEKNITVQYISPGTPEVSIYRNVAKAAIELIINNIPGAEPFERNDIYRREYGESEWTIIASGIGENGSYVDYLVKSEVLYEYMVRTYTTSGGYAASAPVIADIKVNYTVLAPLQHPEQQITLKYDIERSEIQSRGRNFARFAGRKNPVAEYGEQQERGLNIRCTITNKEMLDQLMELLLGDEYLLYRDNKGRYMVCSVSGDIEMQEQRKWYKVSFSLIEVI